MITGKYLSFLTAFLNSSLFKFCFLDNFPELQGGTRELRKIFFDKIPVKKVTEESETLFHELVMTMQETPSLEIAKIIDEHIFAEYELSPEECATVGYVEIQ